jgi:hypothetical protein
MMQDAFRSRPVKDTYGRSIGSVVGVSVDALGQIRSVGVDHGMGLFAEYPPHRAVIDDGFVVIVPAWKTDTDRLLREKSVAQRRNQALEELKVSGEIAENVYDKLSSKYASDLEKLKLSYESLTQAMTKRINELERQSEVLSGFLGETKVQYRTGEIEESIYESAKDYVSSMLERNNKEKLDIDRMLNCLITSTREETSLEQVPPQ